ncbi:MAG: dihydrofolate reductase family protein [Taibaiella sp.]|nr:dihydrofolate reductase family protein [Taibaiella sp.]
MRKIVLLEHVSLDAYVGGPNGEMDWINLDEEMFDLIGRLTDEADTALYGRNTYGMMQAYWPGAADKPGATRHDVHHSSWYNTVTKLVVSDTLPELQAPDVRIIRGNNLVPDINAYKKAEGKDVLLIGSPSVARALTANGLIDDYWLFMNPVILGEGITIFPHQKDRLSLVLADKVLFPCGVIGLHYHKK